MTPSLRIAVAKAMGWKGLGDGSWGIMEKDKWTTIHDSLPPLTLDFMWEAEEMLSIAEQNQYWTTLLSITDEVGRTMDWRHFGHATAEQRAKAWLKVKGVEL